MCRNNKYNSFFGNNSFTNSAAKVTKVKLEVKKIRILNWSLLLSYTVVTLIDPILFTGIWRLIETSRRLGETSYVHLHGGDGKNTLLWNVSPSFHEIIRGHIPAETLAAVRNWKLKCKKLQRVLTPLHHLLCHDESDFRN